MHKTIQNRMGVHILLTKEGLQYQLLQVYGDWIQ